METRTARFTSAQACHAASPVAALRQRHRRARLLHPAAAADKFSARAAMPPDPAAPAPNPLPVIQPRSYLQMLGALPLVPSASPTAPSVAHCTLPGQGVGDKACTVEGLCKATVRRLWTGAVAHIDTSWPGLLPWHGGALRTLR